jgi:hypothetical protein
MTIHVSLRVSFCRKKLNPRILERSPRTLKLRNSLRRRASRMSSLLPTHHKKWSGGKEELNFN